MNKKVGFVSLGCPKNEVDCELMLARVAAAGYEIVPEDIEADVMIVNTCAFIQSAKEEAIENILDLVWLKENRSLKGIIVTGCMAQRYFEEVQKELPEVDAVLALGAETEITKAIEAVLNGKKYYSSGKPEELVIEGDRVLLHEHSAYLRVAEGCSNCCAYCAIPKIRGAFRSRPMESILKEAKDLSDAGIKEIIVVAQDTTRYGLDLYGAYRLPELVKALCDEKFGFRWIRLMYCYPDKITDELLEVMATEEKVCPYIDLPIQHIADPVLSAMNRHGGSEVIRDAVRRIREKVPGAVIRTTVMVGFPGEKEKDVNELVAFMKEAKFERLGAFVYSREEGTPAYKLPGAVPKKTGERRLDRVMQAQYGIAEEYLNKQLGKKVEVLCEGFDPVTKRYFGRSAVHAPEIDGGVWFTSAKKVEEGEFVSVLLEEVMDYDFIGKRV